MGLTNSRSVQDEKLVEAVFQSHFLALSPYASIPTARPGAVYGATATNLIIDARSATSGVANVARGGGTENMEYYKEGKKVYLGVENIHAMRDSLAKVAETLRDADAALPATGLEGGSDSDRLPGVLDRQALRRSGWLKHISSLIDGANIIVRNIHINSSHVLIHCSDGWDRTAQLSTLAQLCLDPYYRTYRGFQVLIEKDWVSFGHRFLDRCGHLSSEKFFLTPTTDGSDGAQAFFASVQNKFTSPSHIKETSPVFHQFLECVRQIQRQYPARFEFNERFLERLHYHLYSCQFGTFLFNNEKDRRVAPDGTSKAAYFRTLSVWDLLNSEEERTTFLNPDYDASLDARDGHNVGDQGVLLPNPKDVKFWNELYGRTDEEMNGRMVMSQFGAEVVGPVEGASDDPALPGTPSRVVLALTDDIDGAAADIVAGTSSAPASVPLPSSAAVPSESVRRSPSPAVPSIVRDGQQGVPPHTGATLTPTLFPTSPSRRPASPARVGAVNVGSLGTTAAGGMKSLWGSISSNASAAFSAVQEAYDSGARDYNANATGRTQSRDRELAVGGFNAGGDPWQSSGASGSSKLDDTSPPARPPAGGRAAILGWSASQGRAQSDQNIGSTRSLQTLPSEGDDPWSSSATRTPPVASPLPSTSSPLPHSASSASLQSRLESLTLQSALGDRKSRLQSASSSTSLSGSNSLGSSTPTRPVDPLLSSTPTLNASPIDYQTSTSWASSPSAPLATKNSSQPVPSPMNPSPSPLPSHSLPIPSSKTSRAPSPLPPSEDPLLYAGPTASLDPVLSPEPPTPPSESALDERPAEKPKAPAADVDPLGVGF